MGQDAITEATNRNSSLRKLLFRELTQIVIYLVGWLKPFADIKLLLMLMNENDDDDAGMQEGIQCFIVSRSLLLLSAPSLRAMR